MRQGDRSMPDVEVVFVYFTGLRRDVFRNVRLAGSWDDAGRPSTSWTTRPMVAFLSDDGCPAFRCLVRFPAETVGRTLAWGVLLDAPGRTNQWGITAEYDESGLHNLSFSLGPDPGREEYYLTHCRRLGANKYYPAAGADLGISFAVWAPHARDVEVVRGDLTSGYIADDGVGVVGEPYPMRRDAYGVWRTDPMLSPEMADFASWDHVPYMFRVTKDDGSVAFRTDLYSRCQVGRGQTDPAQLGSRDFSGDRRDLDGTVSCSVVIDPERVTELFDEGVFPETRWLSEEDFWADEHDPLRPLPTRIEDLVIYELHVGGLGAGHLDAEGNPVPGNLADAIPFLDHLSDLGVNAVELLPLAEFEGWASWGYGTSHYSAIEFSGGGRDQFKYFVRECHRRGIVVLLDVVYNHFHHSAERAEWAYDSALPERNSYYWYEGRAADYPSAQPPGSGGYVDNMSTGYAPRFDEEMVRQIFISSAVALAVEFHVDGFRADQTTSIHSYARLHADGRPVDRANAWGGRFLRQWTRTLRLVKPAILLTAEDHSGWAAVTEPSDMGGLGFDATWYSEFYHNLCGDTGRGLECANLLTTAALGDDRPLALGHFANVLADSAHRTVVYHESHDEAGNSLNNGVRSGRTLVIAVGRAPLVGDTRRFAEARARFAAGMSLLSAGTPMFFMGEEVGAQADYRYDDFAWHREDFTATRAGDGHYLFAFYRDLIRLRLQLSGLRSRLVQVLHIDEVARVLAFRRTDGDEDLLVVANLANIPYNAGFRVSGVPEGDWQEIFNSDSAHYGGWNDGNAGAIIPTRDGTIAPVVPRAGFVILRRR